MRAEVQLPPAADLQPVRVLLTLRHRDVQISGEL